MHHIPITALFLVSMLRPKPTAGSETTLTLNSFLLLLISGAELSFLPITGLEFGNLTGLNSICIMG